MDKGEKDNSYHKEDNISQNDTYTAKGEEMTKFSTNEVGLTNNEQATNMNENAVKNLKDKNISGQGNDTLKIEGKELLNDGIVVNKPDSNHTNVDEYDTSKDEQIKSVETTNRAQLRSNHNEANGNHNSKKQKNKFADNNEKKGKQRDRKNRFTREENNRQEDDSCKERFFFFWKAESPFSQWHYCRFTDGSQDFNCAEQYMMYRKALLFDDRETAEEILQEKEPRYQKELGRKVQNFNQKKWDDNCVNIVKEGNRLKFAQNEDLLKEMKDTYPDTLVEASPYDKIWGIGLREDDSRAYKRKTWRGKNLLGQALTDVRNELMGIAETQTSIPSQDTKQTKVAVKGKEEMVNEYSENSVSNEDCSEECSGGLALSETDNESKLQKIQIKDSEMQNQIKPANTITSSDKDKRTELSGNNQDAGLKNQEEEEDIGKEVMTTSINDIVSQCSADNNITAGTITEKNENCQQTHIENTTDNELSSYPDVIETKL